MLELIYRKKFLSVKANWYFLNENDNYKERVDIQYYHQSLNKIGKDAILFNTLISNLLEEESILFSKISKNFRYEINKSIKENVKSELATDEINEFIEEYNKFATQKKIGLCNENLLKEYKKINKLIITKAYKEDSKLAYHCYIDCGEYIRLLYSVSTYRNSEDKEEKNFIGRANKFLHWDDILRFKTDGFKYYDYGGISEDESTANIAKFKKSFGGSEEYFYNSLVGKTLKGKISINLLRILRRLK